MANSIIRFEKVTKQYENVLALDNVSLAIEKGEFLTTIGSSGAGKTTLIKLINGLLKPDSGTIYVNGKDVSAVDRIQLRRHIGYTIQNVALFPHMTVAKNIAYVPGLSRLWSRDEEKEEVAHLLNVVGLEPSMASRYPDELSGGQQQRVGIARAVAAKPQILLMDEPFGAVDEITRRALQQEILEIHRKLGVTVVFVTHNVEEALLLGSRVLVIDQGKAVQMDTPETVRCAPANDFVRRLVNGEPVTQSP